MTAVHFSLKNIGKPVYSKLQDKSRQLKPQLTLRQLIRRADNKNVFSQGDSTNSSYKRDTITQILHDTIPPIKIKSLSVRFNENLLGSTKLTLEGDIESMKKK